MRIVMVSDLHGKFPPKEEMPEGNMLIFAGDFSGATNTGSVVLFVEWLAEVASIYSNVLVIAGNHDGQLEECSSLASWAKKEISLHATYLEDSGIEIEGVKFWGSPITPEFCNWYFGKPGNSKEIRDHWNLIPNDTDVLITHGPPKDILSISGYGDECGCYELRETVLFRLDVKLHVFGHIHGGTGILEKKGTHYVNASQLGESYTPEGRIPAVIDLENGKVTVVTYPLQRPE